MSACPVVVGNSTRYRKWIGMQRTWDVCKHAMATGVPTRRSVADISLYVIRVGSLVIKLL